MFNNISWASYVYALSFIISIYYTFVLIAYYRWELLTFFLHFRDNKIKSISAVDVTPEEYAVEVMEACTDEGNQPVIRELLLTLQSVIKESGVKNYPKEELLFALQLKLQYHPNVQGSILQNKINAFIKNACVQYCSVHLSKEEESALWSQ